MPSIGIGQAVSFFAKGRKKAANLPNPLWQALCVASRRTKNLKGTIVLGPDIEQYRADIDSDEGLAAKRRLLVIVSLLLLALSVSGASIKEANTFIFRIEFSNHVGLTYLLGAAVIFLLLRYYAYALHYQSKLFDFWSARLLNDYRVFSYNSKADEVHGLLGKRIDIWGAMSQVSTILDTKKWGC